MAAFDEAAEYSEDADEIAHLATSAVVQILERTRRASAANALEPPSIVKVFPANAERLAAVARALVPRNGPRVSVRVPGVLRLLDSRLSTPEEDASKPMSRVLRVVE